MKVIQRTRFYGTSTPAGFGQRLDCDECGRSDIINRSGKRLLPDDKAANVFRERGWRISNRKAMCPACTNQSKAVQEKTPVMAEAKEVQSTPRSAAATGALPVLYMALGDAYDVAAKRYKAGWSDERIAKETGLSVDFVRTRREADFGPLTQNRLDQIVEEANALGKALEAVSANFKVAAEAITKANADMAQFLNSHQQAMVCLDDYSKIVQNIYDSFDRLRTKIVTEGAK